MSQVDFVGSLLQKYYGNTAQKISIKFVGIFYCYITIKLLAINKSLCKFII